ncbi:MAG: OsmC family protein [Bacteroidia bacterium]
MDELNPETMEIEAFIENSNYETTINYKNHTIKSDEPIDHGGTDTGMTPKQLLASSLASCITITLKMYADIKKYKIHKITVNTNYLTAYDKEDPHLNLTVKIEGELDEKAMERMNVIAHKCPIHKMLSRSIRINTNVI